MSPGQVPVHGTRWSFSHSAAQRSMTNQVLSFKHELMMIKVGQGITRPQIWASVFFLPSCTRAHLTDAVLRSYEYFILSPHKVGQWKNNQGGGGGEKKRPTEGGKKVQFCLCAHLKLLTTLTCAINSSGTRRPTRKHWWCRPVPALWESLKMCGSQLKSDIPNSEKKKARVLFFFKQTSKKI